MAASRARLCAFLLIAWAAWAQTPERELRVGVAGTEPFVVTADGTHTGIAVEIWQMVAAEAGLRYRSLDYASVPEAMDALRAGDLDAVVGPVSITAERLQYARFTQPFFSSRLAILSRAEVPGWWQRLAPFFSESFFVAVTGFLTVLTLVGTLIWLAERRRADTHFPQDALHGIGNGIWFAIVTMSTVGYGDLAPKTVPGRIVTGMWIVISLVAATSLIAGIASTLTLTGIDTETIATPGQLRGRDVAAVAGSPGALFAERNGAVVNGIESIADAYGLLEARTVDAVVFDRPQLQYFLRQRQASDVALSAGSFDQQNYGFALPLDSAIQHELNLHLIELRESGAIDRVVTSWLGEE